MNDFLEFDETKKTINSLNLDEFSVQDLKKYIEELNIEIKRVEEEILKKTNILSEAQKFFN